jgi:hypothetical protein
MSIELVLQAIEAAAVVTGVGFVHGAGATVSAGPAS